MVQSKPRFLTFDEIFILRRWDRQTFHDRDYINKQAQYEAIGVMEYWIVDPKAQTVLVLQLSEEDYREIGQFQGGDRIMSPLFPELVLTAEQIFQAED